MTIDYVHGILFAPSMPIYRTYNMFNPGITFSINHLLFKFLHKYRRVDLVGVSGAVWARSGRPFETEFESSLSDRSLDFSFSLQIRNIRRSLSRLDR